VNNKAWADFWASGPSASGCGVGGNRWHAIEAAQGPFWQAFARSLPKGARVLDLATGDGVVMGWMLSVRRDLKLVGVDLATQLPQPPKGSRSKGGVAMESLPFRGASQDAVVSRFGLEYGDTSRAISELARVLRQGGQVGLLTHRLDGPILAYNRSRRDALKWAIEDADLIGKARGSLQLRRVGLGIPPLLVNAPLEAAARFGPGSAGWEFAEAVLRTLKLGWQDSDAAILDVLATLQSKAANEIDRIDSLERACHAAADVDQLEVRFASNGLQLRSRAPVSESGDIPPFADAWLLRKVAERRGS
jgi:SAM-dependent methyltransferase